MNLKSLIGKLNDTTRLAATRAASICVGLGQHEVEVEHLVLALLEQQRCDVSLIVRACGVDVAVLEADLHHEISQFKTGSTRTPVFSRHLPLLLEHAWLIASLATPPGQIRSAHLLVALLTEPELGQLALRASSQFARIPIDEVKHQLEKYTHGSQEETVAAEPLVDIPQAASARTPALDQYTISLTRQAREGKLDPVIGRETEIRQVIDILLRRRQNNPILTGEAPLMEQHFGVRIRDEAVTEAVRLSHRYISGRQLPDKAVGVLDTACARVALAQSGTPALLEDAARQMERIAAEIAALQREDGGSLVHQRLQHLQAGHAALADEHALHTVRWQREQSIVAAIVRQREEGNGAAKNRALKEELAALQGETPMVPLEVDGAIIAAIVSGWTGIPLGKMIKDEIRTVLLLQDALQARILGQPHAIAAVAQRVRTARANLDDPNKPKGVFLFVGPSGVGKTETALALADVLYGGERKLITINMSEYQEAHSVSGLKGSPPGYVGYGQGGVLTEAVRRQPYSVVLLDEIEKAHPDVLELFFQVFDKGVMDDAEGREIDFRNTIIIATANAGSATIMQACLNQDTQPQPEELEALLRPQLVKHFKPAFLGRVKVAPYYPIADAVLKEIIALKLARIGQRIREQHHAEFSYEPTLLDAVLARCTEVDSGARNVDHILNGTLLPEIAQAVLERMAQEQAVARIGVSVTAKGQFKYNVK